MKVDDRVEIIDAMNPDYIGRKAIIRDMTYSVSSGAWVQLDIGGWDWQPSQLKVVNDGKRDDFGRPHGYDWY